jgi:hypothetical protein
VQRLGLSGDIAISKNIGSAGLGFMLEPINNCFDSDVSIFQSASRLDRIVAVESCIFIFKNIVLSKLPAGSFEVVKPFIARRT